MCIPRAIRIKKAFALCITHAGVNPCILVSNARDSQRSFSGDKCVDATRGVSLPCFLLPAGRYQLVAFCPLNCRPRVKLRIEKGAVNGDFLLIFLALGLGVAVLHSTFKMCTSFLTDIHYALLMMSQKESPRNHPWVIPKKVACLV